MMIILVFGVRRALDHGRVQLEPFGLVGIDEHARRARVIHDVFVGDPVRNGNDDFVAGIDQGLHQVEDRVLAADGDHGFFGRIIGAVIGLVAPADGLLQLLDSAGIRVFGEVAGDGVERSALDVVGRWKIRFARAEIDHVSALAPQPLRFGGHRQGRRNADRRNPLSQIL